MTAGFVLNHVTVVDPRDGSLARDVSIVVTGGRIAHVGSAESTGSFDGESIDASGKFAVPGYLDMHAHPLNAPLPAGRLALMLANGVTGFRQMSGTPETLEARRNGTLMPASDAPELLQMSGEILTPANAPTPAAAVAEVRRQKKQGADFIKIIDAAPDVFFAALAESTELGLPYIGHLPPSVNVRDAATAGMRSIEHLGPKDSVLLGASTDEDALRATAVHRASAATPGSGTPIPLAAIMRAVANPLMGTGDAEFARYRRVIDTFSDERCRELTAYLAAAGMCQVPTLTRLRTMAFADDLQYRSDPNLRYVAAPLRTMWAEVAEAFEQRHSAESRATLHELYALQLRLVRPFKAAGTRMLTGADSGGSAGWCIAGVALHQEFDLLAEAGLTPLEILQMATIDAAAALGRESRLGTVAAGKDANLVLLDANPLESVRNLHAIFAVARAEMYYSAPALDALKAKAEAIAAKAPSAPAPPACC